MSYLLLFFTLLSILQVPTPVIGHGRLWEPVSRATAWRKGLSSAIEYTDNQGFCGGIKRQWDVNGGRCGICGDPDDENPGEKEAPGRFATGKIVKTYTSGQVIDVLVEITAHHKGFFEFKVCPNEDFSLDKGQDCFERYPLLVGPSFTSTKYYIPNPPSPTPPGPPINYNMKVKLPAGLVCNKQCIFQWTYTTGNSWGMCPGTNYGQLGCGPQETFRACSDIVITGSGTGNPPPPPPPPPGPSTSAPATNPPSGGSCYAIPPYNTQAGMNDWCNTNCKHVPSYCPPTICRC